MVVQCRRGKQPAGEGQRGGDERLAGQGDRRRRGEISHPETKLAEVAGLTVMGMGGIAKLDRVRRCRDLRSQKGQESDEERIPLPHPVTLSRSSSCLQ